MGGGHISMVLEDYLFEVESSDLFDRGFNFLERTELFEGSIITNPPLIHWLMNLLKKR